MNFSPFGGHFPASIPTIHQFAAKFGSPDGVGGASLGHGQDSGGGARYHGPGGGAPAASHFNQHHGPLAVPVNMGKFRNDNGGQAAQQQHNMMNAANGLTKYHAAGSNLAQHYASPLYSQQQQQAGGRTGASGVSNDRQDKRGPVGGNYGQGQQTQQELCAALLQQHQQESNKQQQEKVKQEQDGNEDNRPGSNGTDYANVLHQQQANHAQTSLQQTPAAMPATWQSLAAPGSTVADYLSHLPASTLPLSLHHFLKYSAENIKKETVQTLQNINTAHTADPNNLLLGSGNTAQTTNTTATPTKKKKKKKPPKERKPRPKPGEIRLTTALDGSTLYCCPECHMAYPEKELLEQHLVGHTLERRFVCDICGAGLKRKDHLTRHKQSHNPERPYVCTVCLKAFKRKEQLTLHFVIHSGEKRHVCPECGKGFYRKDHLRKHTRSHIARRVKAELSQQAGSTVTGLQSGQVAAPGPPVSVAQPPQQTQQQQQQQTMMS